MKKNILLDQGKYQSFDFQEFFNPNCFLGPAYAWIWNDKLTKEEIVSQLKEMAKIGVRAVCIMPEPKDFRPLSMKTRLEPDYLSSEYWEYYRFAVETAKSLGMGFWFYDEGGWPSGGACGKVVAVRPDLKAAVIEQEEVIFDESCIYNDTIAFFEGTKKIDAPIANQKLTRYYSKKIDMGTWTPNYPSLLEKEAVETFINLTHEGLRQSCGDLLGDEIFLSFTDEPSMHWCPWTDDMAVEFKQIYGYDLRLYLPAILNEMDMGEKGNQARIDFYDYWSERFGKTYFDEIRKWCAQNGIFSIGHLNCDNHTEGSARSHGQILRILRRFDIPGVDVIWEQIYPCERLPYAKGDTPYQSVKERYANHYFPRYASSAAHQQGLRWAFTETGGVYGGGFTYHQNHWVCGYQMVRGINLFSQMVISYGEKDYLMAGERPTYSPQMPGRFVLPAFNQWLARSSYLCSLGNPCVNVALYLPVRDIWVGGDVSKRACNLHDNVAYTLERLQVGFDIFDDDVLEKGVLENGALTFGGASYTTLVIPENPYVNRERVQACEKVGVKIVWIKDLKDLALLESQVDRLAYTESKDVRVLKRRLSEGNLYMLFNEGLADAQISISFLEEGAPVEMDAQNGAVRSVVGDLSVGKFTFDVNMASGECIFLFFANMQAMDALRFQNAGEKLQLDNFSISPTRQFIIGEKSFEEHILHGESKEVELGQWKAMFGEDFSGEAVYKCEFTLDEKQAKTYQFLSLGEVEYACKVILNGKEKCVYAKPYVAEVAGLLKTGKNLLEIVVANMPSNQFVYTKNFDKYETYEVGPYHESGLQSERKTLGGGLIGPVQLIER